MKEQRAVAYGWAGGGFKFHSSRNIQSIRWTLRCVQHRHRRQNQPINSFLSFWFGIPKPLSWGGARALAMGLSRMSWHKEIVLGTGQHIGVPKLFGIIHLNLEVSVQCTGKEISREQKRRGTRGASALECLRYHAKGASLSLALSRSLARARALSLSLSPGPTQPNPKLF